MSSKKKRLEAEIADLQTFVPMKKRRRDAAETRFDSESEDELGDDLYYDEEDRQRLEALPEIQRETELAKRREEKEERQMQRRIRRENRARNAQTEEAVEHRIEEKMIEGDEEEEGQLSLGESDFELESEEERPKKKSRKAQHAPIEDNFRDFESPSSQPVAEPVKVPLAIDDLRQCVLSRARLEKWYGEPFFNKSVKGMFVRVNSGIDSYTRADVYKLGRIVELVPTSKPYDINGKEFRHKLRLDSQTSPIEIKFISNSPPTQQELDFWQYGQSNSRSVPSRRELENLRDTMKYAENYVYTEEDIAEQVKKNKEKQRDPIHFAKEKMQLLQEINFARETNNIQQVELLERQLEKLNSQAEFKVELVVESDKNKRLAEINRRNLEKNAHLQELQRLKALEETQRAASAANMDPFARRKTRVTHSWLNRISQKTPSGDSQPEESVSQEVPDQSQVAKDNAIAAALNAIVVPPPPSQRSVSSAPLPTSTSGSSVISLEEYKRRNPGVVA